MTLFLGIDCSTTATKALLMDAGGRVLATAATPYPFDTPRPLWREQSPDLWWTGAQKSVRAVLAESGAAPAAVGGIGLTGQMHGLVLLDAAGEVLRPAILWNDQRTAAQCETIRRRLGTSKVIQLTGNDALTGFTAPKILWVQENEPEIFARVAHILLPKDYVRFKLTGEFATDKAGAAGTLLFDLKARDWAAEMLAALEIRPEWLPSTFEGTATTGVLSATAADALGLPPGIPVVAGGGDQAAQAVGVGAVEKGVVALTLGTSGVVFATTDAPLVEKDGRLHAFCHAVPDKWHFMGVMLSAAGSLQWYRDTFAPETDFAALVAEAETAPPGCDGLFFLPYLTGERTPHPDPLARGAFIGLTVRHRRAHITRSVLEGVAFGLKDGFELMKAAGMDDISQVRISGGGAKSPLWRQILADVLNTELVSVNTTEGAAFGAALLAAVGVGVYGDVVSACAAVVRVTDTTVPTAAAGGYDELYPLYRALYPALKPTFTRIAALL